MAQSEETTNGSELEAQDIIINAVDGLPNVHPNLERAVGRRRDSSAEAGPEELEDLPTSLIVTNICDGVFVSEERKRDMEQLFKGFAEGEEQEDVTFQWLRSFHRLRVNFPSAQAAAAARLQLHQYRIMDCIINCYFAQPVTPVKLRSLQVSASSTRVTCGLMCGLVC